MFLSSLFFPIFRDTAMISRYLTLLVILAVFEQAKGYCGIRGLDANLTRAAVRAAEWLRNYADENNGTYGEGHVNGFAFSALRLFGHSVEQGAEILNAEITKKDGLDSITGGGLAVYILGALATCRDPEQFYGFDLIASLQSKVAIYPHVGFNHPFQYSLAIIALCIAGKDLGKEKYLNYIINNIPAQTTAAHASGDVLAMHIFALTCVKEFVKGEGKSKSLKLEIEGAIKTASEVLRNRQLNDSTFGQNVVTAALSYQGLLAAKADQGGKCSETMKFLLSRQYPDGSFQNLGATIYALPSLVGALPLDMQEIACPKNTPGGKGERQISVCVMLKFNETHKYSNGRRVPPPVCVKVLNGTVAHDILKLAAAQDACYEFNTSKKSMWGRSILSICGIDRKPKEKFYWMIYIDGKSASAGIDYLKPGNGSNLLFEFKQLHWRK